MEITTLTQSNYGNYNSAFQLLLQINACIPEDDLVFTFVKILKGVNLTKYLPTYLHGNQKYNQLALLKTVLFDFADNKRTLRKMEHACKVDLRYLWLSQESAPSFMEFQRFIKKQLTGTVQDIFYDIMMSLIDNIDVTSLFIDGTKIEAYAKKTSFVWKKKVLNYQENLYLKITKALVQMNTMILAIDMFMPKGVYTSRDVRMYIGYLSLLIQKHEVLFVHGKGRKKTVYQRFMEKFLEYEEKLVEYQIHLKICGKRNSYSKTEHDATFMNMKYDYYKRTAVFKLGYNLQI